jgi:hypothetical protein
MRVNIVVCDDGRGNGEVVTSYSVGDVHVSASAFTQDPVLKRLAAHLSDEAFNWLKENRKKVIP